jgi:hypothetical protein
VRAGWAGVVWCGVVWCGVVWGGAWRKEGGMMGNNRLCACGCCPCCVRVALACVASCCSCARPHMCAAALCAAPRRGCFMAVVAYSAVMLFLRIKMPNYMR